MSTLYISSRSSIAKFTIGIYITLLKPHKPVITAMILTLIETFALANPALSTLAYREQLIIDKVLSPSTIL